MGRFYLVKIARCPGVIDFGELVYMAAKKPFGGYTISFGSVKEATVGEVFGTTAITPSDMTKKLWAFVKRKGLAKK